MAPREDSSLLASKHFDIRQSSFAGEQHDQGARHFVCKKLVCGALLLTTAAMVGIYFVSKHDHHTLLEPTGPYQLVECQEGQSFLDAYDFYNGADSLGSAGYNVYVSKNRALELEILNITTEQDGQEYIYMASSSSSTQGPRESIRLEGRKRYNRGLFLLDVQHMPAGPGVWPAWWLTDETDWPDHGEIDVLEGINNQTSAKTALHTSAQCNMYAHVPTWSKTGTWDRAST